MPKLPKIAPELSGLDHVPVDALEPFQGKLKSLWEYDKLKASLLKHGVIVPFFVWDDNGRYRLLDGHQRDRVFEREGWAMDVPVVWVAADNEQDAKRKLLVISSQYGRVTQEGWDEFTFDVPDAAEVAHFDALPFVFGDLASEPEPEASDAEPQSLAERFVVPPFSVLDARQGYWQERKRAWLTLGIRGEQGRKANMLNMNPSIQPENLSSTSVFDPVLCELAYIWFSAPDAYVLDPFAGGSVRGIVAAYLGRKYTGVDLRPEQIAANVEQAAAIVPDNMPTWIVGDSATALPDGLYDFVFSCPPYADLEVYSDDPRDISTMKYADFLTVYRGIIRQCIERLRDDRFACFVVGDVRDKKGIYRNFVSDTIAAFQDAGAMLYNEAVLVAAVGNLPIRVGKQFESGRKLGKTHQNVLVFVKGDGRKATQWCGPVVVGELPPGQSAQLDGNSN